MPSMGGGGQPCIATLTSRRSRVCALPALLPANSPDMVQVQCVQLRGDAGLQPVQPQPVDRLVQFGQGQQEIGDEDAGGGGGGGRGGGGGGVDSEPWRWAWSAGVCSHGQAERPLCQNPD